MKVLSITQKVSAKKRMVELFTKFLKRQLKRNAVIDTVVVDEMFNEISINVSFKSSCFKYCNFRVCEFGINELPTTCTMHEVGNIISLNMDTLEESVPCGGENSPFKDDELTLTATDKMYLAEVVALGFKLLLRDIYDVDHGGNLFVMTLEKSESEFLVAGLNPNDFIKVHDWKPNRTKSNLRTYLFTVEKSVSRATNTNKYKKPVKR